MKVSCVSCQSLFSLYSNLVKTTGSLVRCSNCGYIFMVYRPTLNEEPIVKDTNMDQSILFKLFKVERTNRAREILTQSTDVMKRNVIDEIASIEDFDEAPDSESENGDYADLPDLSEYADMIDWDESPDASDLTEHEKQFDNSTQDLDVNET